MQAKFREYVESLQPSFELLLAAVPRVIETAPELAAAPGIYLFTEGDKHLYVGRTRNLRRRMRNHSSASAQPNQASFAFRLAREATGHMAASYTATGSRAALALDPDFAAAFAEAKARIRRMDLRFVEEMDPLRQALLEIYAAVELATPYNDFNTH